MKTELKQAGLNVKVKSDLLKDFIFKLLDNGFKVYCNADKDLKTYIFIEKEGLGIGYIQNNYFSGLSFSTIHKANIKSGTGYQVETEIINPTIELALKTFDYRPSWTNDKHKIIKYNSFKEYQQHETTLKYMEVLK